MKHRTKKVIAKEGLIIITVLLIASVFLALDYLQSHRVSSPLWYEGPEIVAPGLKLIGPLESDEPEIVKQDLRQLKWYKYKSPPDPDITILNRESIPIEQQPLFYQFRFNKIALFSLILIYPFYWLVRFAIWAIKTLRQKEGTG